MSGWAKVKKKKNKYIEPNVISATTRGPNACCHVGMINHIENVIVALSSSNQLINYIGC